MAVLIIFSVINLIMLFIGGQEVKYEDEKLTLSTPFQLHKVKRNKHVDLLTWLRGQVLAESYKLP